MLSTYISTIRRDDILPRLNELLQTRCNANASVCLGNKNKGEGEDESDIQSYYAKRPELRNYTLGVELDRDLEYTLILKDGTSITDKSAIRAHFGYSTNNNTGMINDENTKGRGNDNIDNVSVTTEELLIRAANQSLLADGLAAITGSEEVLLHPNNYNSSRLGGRNSSEDKVHNINNNSMNNNNRMGLILSGPTLSMTSIVEKCHFTVDLQHSKVEAICVFAICIPIEQRRLVLARGIMIAHFCPTTTDHQEVEVVGKRMKPMKQQHQQRQVQVHPDHQQTGQKQQQQLQYGMQLVKAHHYPTSMALYDASVSLARDEENLLFQDSLITNNMMTPPAITISGSSSSSAEEEGGEDNENGDDDTIRNNVLRWDVRRPFALFRER